MGCVMLRGPSARLAIALAPFLLFLSACAAVTTAPPVEHRTMRIPEGALNKVAVVPFSPKGGLLRAEPDGPGSASMVADLLARFATEELMKHGVQVIGPSDLMIAFEAAGISGSRPSPRVAAEIAAREFGATAVLYGEVSRWRERGGESYGSSSPASVAFNLAIYSAPVPHRLWTSKFDETQRPISENVWNARRYPGSGSRWLTAAELATWGIESSVDTLSPDM